MTEAIPLLEARGVGRREPDTDNWLLRDVSIGIEGGCRLAIVGPTGSGKTLLMRALARLDPIDAGDVFWLGKPVHGDAVPRFRQQAIYLHQRPALVEGSVEQNLLLPFTLRGQELEFSRAAVLALLQQANLNDSFLRRSSRDVSGGEAQIVAVLRAVQLQPTLLFLDEPTAALDDESARMIEQVVKQWFHELPSKRAFVWVSHNKEQVARVADLVVTMSEGRLLDGHAVSGGTSR